MENPLQPKNSKAKSVRIGIAGTLLTIIPALALVGYSIPTKVNAASDSDLCVTATRVDDPTIVSKRGWCEDEVVAPSPTATASPTATPTATVTPTAEPVVTPTPTPTPTPVNNFASLTWTSKAVDYGEIASSADGTRLIGSSAGNLMLSVDSGATWTTKVTYSASGGKGFYNVDVSQDGTKMIAATRSASADDIWKSTNSGATWTKAYSGFTSNYGNTSFLSVEISDDGKFMTAYDDHYGRNPYSTDGGVTWGYLGKDFRKSTISGDGNIIFAGNSTSTLYKRVNNGAWTLLPPLKATSISISSIDMSSDGKNILVGGSGGPFYVSRDSGVTWEEHTEFGAKSWGRAQVSNDGTKMIMVSGTSVDSFYVSTDSGASWKTMSYPAAKPNNNSVELSPDGTRVILAQTNQWSIGKFGP